MAGGAFQTGLRLVAAFVLVLFCAAGRVRREGRNSDCKWPAETGEHRASVQHFSRDAEFAEDLAIHYADVHHWSAYSVLGESREAWDAGRDRCMGTLFAQTAKEHGVPLERVYSSLGRDRGYVKLESCEHDAEAILSERRTREHEELLMPIIRKAQGVVAKLRSITVPDDVIQEVVSRLVNLRES